MTNDASGLSKEVGKRFRNLDADLQLGGGLIRWQWRRWRRRLPLPPRDGYAQFAARWVAKADFACERPLATQAWWLGQATVLLRIEGRSVITDPHLSGFASPLTCLGPRRKVPLAASVSDLPNIDTVLISHDHYDHLDDLTVRALAAKNPGAVWHVPLGLGRWLERRGVGRIVELDWWTAAEDAPLRVRCVPAQHWSGRGLTDRMRTLWCGWVVQSRRFRFYFAGDTGYFAPLFKEIRTRLGPFDFAALPIGAYEPRWFMRSQHINPEEAVRIHREIGARRSLAIHWGTFELSDESLDEPVASVRKAMCAAGVGAKEFLVLPQGQRLYLE